MAKSLTALIAAALIVAPAALAAEESAPPPKTPSAMTPTEINAHNAGLAPSDPNFIKCRKTVEIGSLVKKNRVCRTNAKWKEVIANSSQNARDTTEAMTSKAGNSN
ncbi:hypothetical protein [Sphingopyxis solisilvae]|uniref:hypothetical protein n=1 Tax=Sphingopyxis solisilvae TaxID=1886788 RepID=UPI001892B96C|nr:hypothetical protein [Sphingopyxis solisilvae]